MAPIDTNPASPACSQPRSSALQEGFTLVEILVVLAIASIMAAMMVGGIRQLRGLVDLSERSAAQSVADAVADHVAEGLAGALELPLLGGASVEQVPMAGSSHEIRFNAVVRVGFHKRALREVSFGMEAPAKRRTLVRTVWPRRLNRDELARGEERLVLHPDVAGITFRYMALDAAGNAVWLDDWNARTMLPVAVQFQVELKASGEPIRTVRTVTMPL